MKGNREFQTRSEKRTQKMFKVVTHPNFKRGHKKNNFEIVSFFFKTGIAKRVKAKIVAGVAATSTHCRLSEALRWTCSESEGKVGARAQTLHTTHVDTRRRSRRRERDSAPRGNGGPFHTHTKKELRLEKGQSTSKLLRSQVAKSRRMTIKLTYGPAYIYLCAPFFPFRCVEGVAPPLIWGQVAQVRLSNNSSKNKIWPTVFRLKAKQQPNTFHLLSISCRPCLVLSKLCYVVDYDFPRIWHSVDVAHQGLAKKQKLKQLKLNYCFACECL